MAPGWARDVDFWRDGRKVGQGSEQVVGFVKKVDLGVAVAFSDCEEYAGLALGAEGDVGAEACAATGFFQDSGGAGWGAWVGRLAEAIRGQCRWGPLHG